MGSWLLSSMQDDFHMLIVIIVPVDTSHKVKKGLFTQQRNIYAFYSILHFVHERNSEKSILLVKVWVTFTSMLAHYNMHLESYTTHVISCINNPNKKSCISCIYRISISSCTSNLHKAINKNKVVSIHI